MFDRQQFAILLRRAKGNRSINRFGSDCKVDPGYISRLLRGLVNTAPSAAIINKLAEKAENGVTLQELLTAAGYLQSTTLTAQYAADEPGTRALPVIKRFIPGSHSHEVESWISSYSSLTADFALRIKDNSYISIGIYPGDIAICQIYAHPDFGKLLVLADPTGKPVISFPGIESESETYADNPNMKVMGIVNLFIRESDNIISTYSQTIEKWQQQQKWNQVIEAASNYNIQPDTAIALIKSLGTSIKGFKSKGNPSKPPRN